MEKVMYEVLNYFDNFWDYGDFIIVVEDGRYGVYARDGSIILEPEWFYIQFNGYYFVVLGLRHYGVYDLNGNIILAPELDNIELLFTNSDFSCIIARKSSKYVMCVTDGSVFLKTEWDNITSCVSSLRRIISIL